MARLVTELFPEVHGFMEGSGLRPGHAAAAAADGVDLFQDVDDSDVFRLTKRALSHGLVL